MKVAKHQPDLLPYSGFFYKLAKADVMDIGIYDQYLRKGYQRRVTMRGEWANVPVTSYPVQTPICDVRIDSEAASTGLLKVIHGRYSGAQYYKERAPEVRDRIADIKTNRLWQYNVELIIMMRDLLGIRTPVSIGPRSIGPKGHGIVSVLKEYGATTYLSGTGARAYMGDCQEFKDAGIAVEWSRHKPTTGDSILSVYFDYQDPLSIVLLEEPEPDPIAEVLELMDKVDA